jgi:hypothetical protein
MIGLLTRGARRGTRFGACVARTLRPLIDLAARPPMVPPRYWPGRLVARLAEEGRDQRRRATATALDLLHRTSDPDQEDGPVAVTTDPAVAEWIERVFHHPPLAQDDSGEPPP